MTLIEIEAKARCCKPQSDGIAYTILPVPLVEALIADLRAAREELEFYATVDIEESWLAKEAAVLRGEIGLRAQAALDGMKIKEKTNA